jgi:hypothetical protein
MKTIFSHTPELQDIEQLLFNMQLTPADSFYQRMEYAPWKSEIDSQRRYVRKQRMQWAGICAVILLLISFIFTPMGQALASEIYQFFIRASGNTLPLAPEERMEVVPTITPEPTYFPALLPADQVEPIPPQPTEPPAGNDRTLAYQNLDLQTAQSLVDFLLIMPSSLPKEYRLTNMQYIPELKAIRSTYASPSAGSGEFFSLTQGTNLAPFKIGADTPVEKLSINEHELEWVHGSWFTANGADESTWEPQAPLDTLRWEADGVSFELVFIMNEPSSPANLSKEDMRFVAENLGSCAVLQGSEKYTCEVQQAAAAAGFIPWQFEQAPVGLSFNVAWYQPGLTAIWYGKGAGELGVLQSRQDFTALETSDWFSVPEDAIQQVTVDGQPAEYVNGGFVSQPGEDSAKWEQDSGHIRLRWKNGDWWFQIVKWGQPNMEPQELADLAATLVEDESLVNINAQSESTQEEVNQAYLSIAEVEEVIGKSIKIPSIIPVDLPFSHIRLFSDDAVMVFYGDFAADKMRINGSILTFSQYPKFDDFNASMAERYVNYPPEVIHDVSVNGIPAKLVYGTYGIGFDENGNQTNFGTYSNDPFTVTLSWQDEESVYFLNFSASMSSGTRISDEDMIQIAESVK